ncbi:MAG TPA: hypothetical protein EYG85_02200 [Crocinitomix sp.]|nr:hypothetical protein [Crocinitomix sp.]
MRKLVYILTMICFVFTSHAQKQKGIESYKKPFNIKRKPGIMRFYTLYGPTETSAEKFDRLNTDFYYNSWLGDVNGVETQFYALGHNINLMWDIPFSKTSRFGVAIGAGYSHFSIRHTGKFNFYSNPLPNQSAYSVLTPDTTSNSWINRTVINFLEVPFEFRIRSRKERPKFKFYPGFKAGYMVGIYHKWRVGTVFKDLKYKEFNFPDLQRFHYGPTLRIGLNNIMLFAYYDMTYLFTSEKSSQLQLFSAGISIGWF